MGKLRASLNHELWVKSGMGPTADNMYLCETCTKNKITHQIIRIPGPPVEQSGKHAVKGEPTTKRKCTGCGAEDGPWVDA